MHKGHRAYNRTAPTQLDPRSAAAFPSMGMRRNRHSISATTLTGLSVHEQCCADLLTQRPRNSNTGGCPHYRARPLSGQRIAQDNNRHHHDHCNRHRHNHSGSMGTSDSEEHCLRQEDTCGQRRIGVRDHDQRANRSTHYQQKNESGGHRRYGALPRR